MSETTVTTSKWTDSDDTTYSQYKSTVPKSIVEALDMQDATLEWKIEDADTLRVEIKDAD